ncbi:MAG: LysR family transcriptional regulator [Firmicutes bacterium]|nr:LysR family transcriptional regulator [Bacillota bacterium]
METGYIKEFITIADEKSFSRASEKLFISQSVLTKHIQKLEAELGFSFFVRTYPLTLTPAGEYFYENISSILDDVTAVTERAKEISMGFGRTLLLGLPAHTKAQFLPDLLKFKKTHPDVDIKVDVSESDQLLKGVQNDLLDIAILFMVDAPDSLILQQFSTELISKGKMCVIAGKENKRFAGKKDVSVEELDGAAYLLIDDLFHRALYKNLSALALDYGVSFGSPVLAENTDDALVKVLLNDGVLLIPCEDENIFSDEFYQRLPIREDGFTYSRYYVWKKTNKSSSVKEFIGSLRGE